MVALVVLAAGAQAHVAAAEQNGDGATAAVASLETKGAQPLTAADLNAWLDGYIPLALGPADIAGAVVVVVRDGRIVTERGFGYADVAARTPVDPERTLFRPGSVSKLVTWTAVMQLVEQGKISLDGDINRYLDFRIEGRDGQPITMRHLMQHTAGFEERAGGLLSQQPQRFEQWLKDWIPERVFAPGTTPAYSNYGAALAGYIVQRVSGEPFEDYVEEHIFRPLDMAHATFRQPLGKDLAALMSKGYRRGSEKPGKFEFLGAPPAGALSASGEDMAHFMIAHLQNGEYKGRRILREETAKLMHDSPLRLMPLFNGMELGFYETAINGREVIGHHGDLTHFHSALHLFLKENTGIYVSFNSEGRAGSAGWLRRALFEDFADRYFGGSAVKQGVDDETAKSHAKMLVGSWAWSRRSFSNFGAVVGLFTQVRIAVGAKGELVTDRVHARNGGEVKWIEVAPFLWCQEDGHARLAAKIEDGRASRIGFDSPVVVFDRPGMARDAAWLLPALLVAQIVLIVSALSWPLVAILRRVARRPLTLSRSGIVAHRLARLGAWLMLAVILLWHIALEDPFHIVDMGLKLDWVLRLCRILSLLVPAAVLAALWDLACVWRGRRHWLVRAWGVVLSAASLIVLYVAVMFNLIGWSLNY